MIDADDRVLLAQAGILAGTILSGSAIVGLAVRIFLLASGL